MSLARTTVPDLVFLIEIMTAPSLSLFLCSHASIGNGITPDAAEQKNASAKEGEGTRSRKWKVGSDQGYCATYMHCTEMGDLLQQCGANLK